MTATRTLTLSIIAAAAFAATSCGKKSDSDSTAPSQEQMDYKFSGQVIINAYNTLPGYTNNWGITDIKVSYLADNNAADPRYINASQAALDMLRSKTLTVANDSNANAMAFTLPRGFLLNTADKNGASKESFEALAGATIEVWYTGQRPSAAGCRTSLINIISNKQASFRIQKH
jgi:hypothetical protein